VKAIKRLWMYLVHEENVQEIFIRYIFSSKLRTGYAVSEIAFILLSNRVKCVFCDIKSTAVCFSFFVRCIDYRCEQQKSEEMILYNLV
jgi:hypothetical protein